MEQILLWNPDFVLFAPDSIHGQVSELDSWRFTHAGADMTLISSASKTAVIESRPRTFEENLSMIHDIDLIIVEGYKQEKIPRIGISRKATGKGLPGIPDDYVAVVTDDESLAKISVVPCFGLDDVEILSEFIMDLTQILFS